MLAQYIFGSGFLARHVSSLRDGCAGALWRALRSAAAGTPSRLARSPSLPFCYIYYCTQEHDDMSSPSPMKSEPAAAALKDGGSVADLKQMADFRYHFDAKKLEDLRSEAPWTKDAKYFRKVAVSPSAVMKMMMHCQSGVDKGISKGGNPIEVMGLLMGRPDHDTPKTLVITDAFPLPIEGFETRVIADDANVVNHMIALGECLERTRKEKFMGWYHSHPFDLGEHSHCFLSQTDLSTQLQWQRAEDPHGNPFVAIVLDPLRSVHKSTPEIKAFRAYPPEYNSPVPDECPNGTIETSDQARLEQWGSCWNRYYELDVEYYMSSTARGILEQLTQDYLWMRTLGGNSNAEEDEKRLPDRISKTATNFKSLEGSSTKLSISSFGDRGTAADPAAGAVDLSGGKTEESHEPIDKAVKEVVDMAVEQIVSDTLQQAKLQLFTR